MYRSRLTQPLPSCFECEKKGDSFFCSLDREDLDIISDQKNGNFYKKGQVIFYEGNHPQGLYCISSGKVKIHKLGDQGKDQIVRFAGSSDILGYRALLSDDLYSATATAMEDSVICKISKEKFFEVLEKNQALSLKAIKMLTNDLKRSEQKIIDITQKPVRERIAEALLILKESFGLKEDNQTLNTQLTRREIGEIAGVTSETTIRTLSDFNKEGIIELNKKDIVLTNLKALVTIANICD